MFVIRLVDTEQTKLLRINHSDENLIRFKKKGYAVQCNKLHYFSTLFVYFKQIISTFRCGFGTGEQNGGCVTLPTWPRQKSIRTVKLVRKFSMTSADNMKVLWHHNQQNLSRPIRYKRRDFLTTVDQLKKVRIRKRASLPPTTPP